MRTAVIIRSMQRAGIGRDCLLRKQEMSKALKVGMGKAMRIGQPGDKRVLLGPKT